MKREIDITKKYRTRDGQEVTELRENESPTWPIAATVAGDTEYWDHNGRWFLDGKEDPRDLILVEDDTEPAVKLPEPPEGMKWDYRGKGWKNGGERIEYAFATPREIRDREALSTSGTPEGEPDHHYGEAVPAPFKVTLHGDTATVAQGIALPEPPEGYELDASKKQIEKIKADFARADHDRQVRGENPEDYAKQAKDLLNRLFNNTHNSDPLVDLIIKAAKQP